MQILAFLRGYCTDFNSASFSPAQLFLASPQLSQGNAQWQPCVFRGRITLWLLKKALEA